MPQVELTRGEYGLEGEIRLPAWEHWQIQEQAQPIRVDFGGDRVEEGQELTESYRTALAYLFAGQKQIQNAILRGILEHLAQQRDDLLSGTMEEDFSCPECLMSRSRQTC